MARRTVVLHASGHSQVRATHEKSLELTAEAEITARATCVVGVGMAPSPQAGLLRGPVSLALEVNEEVARGWGVINPAYGVGDRVVLRRAASGGPETLVVRSTLTAADLPPALAEQLRAPGAQVRLTISEEEATPSGSTRQPLVLVGSRGAAPASGRLAALWENADIAVELPGKAAARAAGVVRDSGVIAATLPDDSLRECGPHPAMSELTALIAAGDDVCVASLLGDPLLEVMLAAGLPPVPVRWLGQVGRAAARTRPVAPGPVPSVLVVQRQDATAVLGRLADAYPNHPVGVRSAALDVGTAVRWITAADAPAAVADHPAEAALLVVAALESGPSGDLGAIARALVEAGVPPRTISDALAPFGLDRRELYARLPHKDR
ncbi:MAG TPA: DUF371 domain-containing protein [Kineosporiaceae bacterium]|nr:DUF371 domain-containing protein [Kineosporiaceae bacterium]